MALLAHGKYMSSEEGVGGGGEEKIGNIQNKGYFKIQT